MVRPPCASDVAENGRARKRVDATIDRRADPHHADGNEARKRPGVMGKETG
jgi:hypothetical protein